MTNERTIAVTNAVLERRGGRVTMRCADEVPWEAIRRVMRRAPQWSRQVDGLSGSGEPPTLGGRLPGDLSHAAVCYYDLKRALLFLERGGLDRRCRGPRREARTLAEIVRLQLEGYSHVEIARRLRRKKRRKLRGGQFWTRSAVAHALERAYRCLCCPEGGAFLTPAEWE